MKKQLILVVMILAAGMLVRAQKFAYVDTQYILDNIPEFSEAQAQLDEISNQWQKEIEAKLAEIDKMYKDYQTQAVLLPDDMKKKKEQEIVDKERDVKNLQKTRFGKDGDLFKKRQELVKPIQEKVYNAIQDLATNNNYAVVFDKGGSLTMMYANPKYDISDEVLDNMGASLNNRKSRSKTTPPAQSQQGQRQGGSKEAEGVAQPPQKDGGAVAPPPGGTESREPKK